MVFVPAAGWAVVLSVLLPASDAVPVSCVTRDQPNAIAELYPGSATGILNATIAVLPIALELARQVVPAQYNILEHAYRDLLPSFPQGMYPLVVQGAHDHDIQLKAYNLTIPDFSRVGFEFPFLDLLGDGYTSFSWHPAQLISAQNAGAIQGSEAYGTLVTPATFEPSCDAYTPGGTSTVFRAVGTASASNSSSACQKHYFADLDFAVATWPAYPLDFFKNVTNQPSFANGTQCDQQIRLFGTDLAKAPYEPRFVEGRVVASMLPFGERREWAVGVYGLQIATPFVENNYLVCQSLQGYAGVDIPGI